MVAGPLSDAQRVSVQYMVAYCLVWGLGGNLEASCHDKFDQAVRKLLDGTANYPAAAGTVLDYRLDVERCAVNPNTCACVVLYGGTPHGSKTGPAALDVSRRQLPANIYAATSCTYPISDHATYPPSQMSSSTSCLSPYASLPLKTPHRSAFVRWEASLPPFAYDPCAPFHSIVVPTVDTERYGAMLRSYLEAGRPALLVGDSGAGKSSVVAQQLALLAQAPSEKGCSGMTSALLACSALTGVGTVQGLLHSKLAKRNGR